MAKKMSLFKFLGLALCILAVPVFAGCSLVTTNLDKYLAETVASYDNGKITVSREELLITYNYIGNSRYDNSSTATEDGVKNTIELEIKRKLLVELLTSDSIDMVKIRVNKNIDKVNLTTYQYNEVWQNVYDYVNSAVKSYETELRTADGITSSEEEEEEDAYTKYEYASFDKQYNLVYVEKNVEVEENNQKVNKTVGEWTLEKVTEETGTATKFEGLYTEEQAEELSFSELAKIAYKNFREQHWTWTDSKILGTNSAEKSYSDEAWTKYINNLLRNESERNLTKTNEDAFLRNVQMIYKIYYQNAVLSAFQEKYTKDNITITKKEVVDKYNELYKEQVEKYTVDSSKYDSAVSTGAGDVYYMKDYDKYMIVNHILVKFSDDQNTRIEAEATRLKNGEITKSVYEENVAKIKAETTGYNRETKQDVPLNEIFNQIQRISSTYSTASDKITAFGNLMHIYSEDDNTIGAEAGYYIPTDTSITDAMQESFANASRELYNNGKGKIGDMTTSWVETSYGYHIIMYTGLPTNVDGTSQDTDSTLIALNSYKLNPLYNKTMLDKVISQITPSVSYSAYEEDLLNYLMEGKTIVLYDKSFKDLYS